MKKPAFTLVLCLLLALLTMLRSYAAAADALPHITPASTDTLDVPCAAAILIDEDSGTVLYEKNADQQRPIASITKVMTLLLAFEALSAGRISLSDTVPVSEHAYHMGGSQIWLEPGEQMTLDDMLKAICISSANDAAVAVAEFVGGSEPAFVQQMNARAAELGLTNTHFENACGLDAEGHLSTARDVAMMSREILLHHAEVRNYCSIWMDSLRDGATQLVNTNKLLKTYNGITGLKTGTTSQAGVCISASAERNGLRLIAVVLGADSGKERFAAATALLDYGFANYEKRHPADACRCAGSHLCQPRHRRQSRAYLQHADALFDAQKCRRAPDFHPRAAPEAGRARGPGHTLRHRAAEQRRGSAGQFPHQRRTGRGRIELPLLFRTTSRQFTALPGRFCAK